MAEVGLVFSGMVLLLSQVQLPGTQPNELTLPIEPSSTCRCHDTFDPMSISEPGQSYKATMMALSIRDPIFRAALNVSFADRPNLTDLCLRCHAPMAWLNGRSEPGDGSLLTESDLEGITCDICHRMTATDPPLIGSGQYTIAPSTTKRSRRGSAPFGGHGVTRDDFPSSAEMCGVCHSLFNPAERAHDAAGNDLGFDYYEQRTYEEWVDSVFPGQGVSCIDCHMKTTTGAAVEGGESYSDLQVHSFVGGNKFAVNAVRLLYPNLRIAAEASQVTRWADESLQAAAELEIMTPAINVASGENFELDVRITNKTGHKLPSGYPEGRRVYLEVSLEIGGMAPQILSGEWNAATGDLVRDSQLRAYETDHGRFENGISERTHHLILMNQVLLDTRIPPEGFMPSFDDMIPMGYDFGSPPYRHWDDAHYTFAAPTVSGPSQGIIKVRALFQETDGEVIRFLLNETAGSPEAANLEMVWEMLGHAPPQEMVVAELPITVTEPVALPDAGMAQADGGSGLDGGGVMVNGGGGCKCSAELQPSKKAPPGLLLLGLSALWRLRRRSRSSLG